MALTLAQLESETAKLSPVERHPLIDRLRDFDSPGDSGVEAAWDAVVAGRAKEILDGTVKTRDAFEVVAEARRRLRGES